MPKAILEKLPASARKIYEDAWSAAKEKGWDDARAAQYAIGAVKKAGFRKNETTDRWSKMAEPMFAVFGEPVNNGEWLEVACTGTVVDMNGRQVSISENDLDSWIQAFEEDERGQELPITFDHPKAGGRAGGWVKGLRKGATRVIRGAPRTTLLMKPEWTPDGRKSVDNGDYKYFSVEILPENMLRAVSLVNFPAVKGLRPATEPASLGEYYLQEFYMAETQMKCKECGGPIPEGSEACPNCGAKLEETQDKEKQMAEKKDERENVVSLEEFNALRSKLDELSGEREKLGQEIAKLQETSQRAQDENKKLSEQVEAQDGQISTLVDLNNMLRLHEMVAEKMQLTETTKIAPAHEEQIIELLLMAETPEKEKEILDFVLTLAKGEAVVEFGERGSGQSPNPLTETEDTGRIKMHEAAKKLAEEQGIDYRAALRELSRKEAK